MTGWVVTAVLAGGAMAVVAFEAMEKRHTTVIEKTADQWWENAPIWR